MNQIKFLTTKNLFLFLFTFSILPMMNGQSPWTVGTNQITYNGGNVGIGLAIPTEKFHIKGTGSVYGLIKSTNSNSYWVADSGNHGCGLIMKRDDVVKTYVYWSSSQAGGSGFGIFTGGKNLFQIKDNGNVIVGDGSTTEAPPAGFRLSVDKGIITKQVKVCLDASSWCDYVFDKDYPRNSIAYVENFINENKHLPNVPSAEEVEEEGINLGEMDATLLRQIEEIWLHVIELKKENEALKKEIEQLKKG